MNKLLLSDFDYNLPKELIAQTPAPERDQSRLLIVDRDTNDTGHAKFDRIIDHLGQNDILVINNVKVIPARLYGQKKTGGKVEILLLRKIGANERIWEALITDARKFKPGDRIYFKDEKLEAEIKEKETEGKVILSFNAPDFEKVLSRIGKMPLPPYIKRVAGNEDVDRYQTIYAQKEGAVAAPTAGLHFTPALLEAIKANGVKIIPITLYVGMGTFSPVREQDITNHKMETEFYEILEDAATAINEAITMGKNVVSVGTTAVRALESAAEKRDGRWQIAGGSKGTDIFIYPGYEFKIVKKLITNFHLPKSTLLMLVSAFAGTDTIKKAYRVAVEEKYRFFSYGDAMFIK
ncbi:MAG: tRNA preQ1(34) S-adenosylmethionine ribosyltransferase-isomerase QueA [bacterium]|nr:tRNA preQ1(34) S-adenosylmethionine ribosyltransferase-isomerase QueA [bacterium]MDD5756891.1 tRNA preQ1(34) S-adenosylmethionine ribosyltransferase-isomerase QueA [bacterium]